MSNSIRNDNRFFPAESKSTAGTGEPTVTGKSYYERDRVLKFVENMTNTVEKFREIAKEEDCRDHCQSVLKLTEKIVNTIHSKPTEAMSKEQDKAPENKPGFVPHVPRP